MTHSKKSEQRQFGVILLIMFLGFLGVSIPYLIFPALFLTPEYSILPPSWDSTSRALLLGITLASYPLGQFLGSPILGSLSDDYGRKRILCWSLLIAAFFNLLSGIAISSHLLILLIFSRFMAGLMEGNIAIARAMAADLTTISKHDSFGKINAALSIAYLLGPLLGGLMTAKELFEGLTFATPFYVTAVIFLCLTGFASVVLKARAVVPKDEVRSLWKRINLFKRMSQLFQNRYLRFLMIVSTCFTLAADIFYEFGPVYLTVKWSLEPVQLVLFNGVLCLGLAAGNGWLPGIVTSRMSNRRAIPFCTAGFAFALLGVVLTGSKVGMILFFALSGLVIGLGVTLITVKISNAASDTIQGEVMGVQLSLRVLGDAIICLFGGVLLLISPRLILLVAALSSVGSMVYYKIRKY
jgi:DHA1 family tetracycline resistance protein-like MFS transporter